MTRMRPFAVFTSILLIAMVAQARAAEGLNEAVRQARDVAGVALSPDGQTVAALITETTAEGGRTHIWLLGARSGQYRQITFSTRKEDGGETSAVWSPDGSALYFQSSRDKVSRVMRLSLQGGEAERLVIARTAAGRLQSGWGLAPDDAVEVQARRFDLSPDGRFIALIAGDGETAAKSAAATKRDDAVKAGQDDQTPERLYLVEVATGKAREIALPDNAAGARFNAASDALIAVTEPESDDLGPAAKAWRVAVNSGAPVQLPDLPATVRIVAFAAQDQALVYSAQCQDDAPPGCNDLYVYDFKTKASRNLTQGLKGNATNAFIVAKDGMGVFALLQRGVRQVEARIALKDGAITDLDIGQPVVFDLASNPAQSAFAYVAGGPGAPRSVYYAAAEGAKAVKLNTPPLRPAGWPSTPSRIVRWKSGDLSIEGVLYLPAGASPAAKVPLIVHVHGGPAGVFQDYDYNIVDLLVSEGWAVLQPNPRGSLGYGTAFLAANKNDLGGGDFQDIMTGVDEAIANFPIDANRLALIGYSYGGEMAGFAVGKTDRFKAIISGAPVIDQFSEYGTEDGSFYDRWYFGKPWEHIADAARQSPIAAAHLAKTPFLLFQGEADTTDPLGQSQEMYRALKQAGAPVELVIYPRENHGALHRNFYAEVSREPWHGVDLRKRMIAFLKAGFGDGAK